MRTILAASGSSQMLNSAEAVAFPWSWAPPMITSSGMRSMIRGSFCIAVAMFERGPDGDERDVAVGREVGVDEPVDRVLRAGAARRLGEVELVAVDPGRGVVLGLRAGDRPRHAAEDRDLWHADPLEHPERVLHAQSSTVLPLTTVAPTSSRSGERAAVISATASSVPVSTSRITLVAMPPVCPKTRPSRTVTAARRAASTLGAR